MRISFIKNMGTVLTKDSRRRPAFDYNEFLYQQSVQKLQSDNQLAQQQQYYAQRFVTNYNDNDYLDSSRSSTKPYLTNKSLIVESNPYLLREEPVKTHNSTLDLVDRNKSSPHSKTTMLQELLECPICMNTFENPHVLPCQHTFCKKCISSLKKNAANSSTSESISCPICRESHVLSKGLDGLTANYTMKRLIELESMAVEKEKAVEAPPKETAKCIVCQKYTVLTVCTDCSYMLCDTCLKDPNHDILIGNY